MIKGADLRSAVLDPIYRLHQTLWSSWVRRRYARDLEAASTFCLFIGYPRSGHSLVGAMLNAHRQAVISHELNAPVLIENGCTREELFSRIVARAAWFNLRGNTSNYRYQVPNQWQGRFQGLKVIGDKRGGAVTRCLAADPDFLHRVRSLVGVPTRFIHVVRNPFDNISAISIAERRTLQDSIDYYFYHCRTTARLDQLCEPQEIITIHHEDMIHDPAATLSELCLFLELSLEPGYIADCCRIVFTTPTFTRRRIFWPTACVREVEARLQTHPFLQRYAFDDDGAERHVTFEG
jgi:hypothetical protein